MIGLRGMVFLTLLFSSSFGFAKEIYQCRDEGGGMVFSDKPCLSQAYGGGTQAHALWREVWAISRLGESMTNLRGASPDERQQCKVRMHELTARIENLKPKINNLSERFQMLVQAYETLPECVSCGQSATYYCRESDKLLKTAANELQIKQ